MITKLNQMNNKILRFRIYFYLKARVYYINKISKIYFRNFINKINSKINFIN